MGVVDISQPIQDFVYRVEGVVDSLKQDRDKYNKNDQNPERDWDLEVGHTVDMTVVKHQ